MNCTINRLNLIKREGIFSCSRGRIQSQRSSKRFLNRESICEAGGCQANFCLTAFPHHVI
jgi:hypothetical protein